MEDKLTFFYCEDLLVGMENFYSERIVQDFAKDNNCKILEELHFEAFVWVCVE